jgi:hypothetical protein
VTVVLDNRRVADVDRLACPKTSRVLVLVHHRLVAALEILADRLVEPPSEVAVVGRDRNAQRAHSRDAPSLLVAAACHDVQVRVRTALATPDGR